MNETLGRDTRVVEIVADHSTEAINLAHRLHPRYVHYQRDGLSDLVSVVNNILQVEPEVDHGIGLI